MRSPIAIRLVVRTPLYLNALTAANVFRCLRERPNTIIFFLPLMALCVLKSTIFFFFSWSQITLPLFLRRDGGGNDALEEEGRHRDIYIQAHIQRGRGRGERHRYTAQHIERERGATLLLGFQDITIQKVAGTEPIFFPWFGATTVASLGWWIPYHCRLFNRTIILPLWWRTKKKGVYPEKRFSWTLQWSQVGRMRRSASKFKRGPFFWGDLSRSIPTYPRPPPTYPLNHWSRLPKEVARDWARLDATGYHSCLFVDNGGCWHVFLAGCKHPALSINWILSCRHTLFMQVAQKEKGGREVY